MEGKLKKQFRFSIDIEADSFEEAKERAMIIFGTKNYNERVYWEQIFKKSLKKEIIEPSKDFTAEL